MTKKRVVEIKRWTDNSVIATGEEGETLADLVVRKVAERANLCYADLRYADLRYADLCYANLCYADLYSADLCYADLRSADLRSANLCYADLYSANLRSANLCYADLPSPTAVLLAVWGSQLSPQLVADLMLFDSTCHPDPEAFDRWAQGGDCPYSDVHVQRAANFSERRELWGKGQPCRPYDLMARVLAEACPDWTKEQMEEFEAKFKIKK